MAEATNVQDTATLHKRSEAYYLRTGLPFVTLSYAQSIDGSIATKEGKPYPISCRESLVYTHKLRSINDGILVGIGTVLSDDPLLTTRLVRGDNPKPIILDTNLRTPLTSRLVQDAKVHPLIVTSRSANPQKKRALLDAGAQVMALPESAGLIDLTQLLVYLGQSGLRRLLVEGGSRIITEFLSSRKVQYIVITISMRFMDGFRVLASSQVDGLESLRNGVQLPKLRVRSSDWLGTDLIIQGEPSWEERHP